MSERFRSISIKKSKLAVLFVALSVVFGLAPGFVWAASAQALDVYVDNTMSCSDKGSGTAATPYCTIAAGTRALPPGSTLFIGNGTYPERVKPPGSGTADSPVTITAWPGKSPTVGPGAQFGVYLSARNYITVSNLTILDSVDGGIYVTDSSNITLINNTVRSAGEPLQDQTASGITVKRSTAITISGNTVDHNSGHGIYVNTGNSGVTVSGNYAAYNAEGWRRNGSGINILSPGVVVMRNVTHDNEDSGIQFYRGGDNGLAVLNVTYNNGDHGIDNLHVSGGRIISNTVYRNCTTGINVEGTSGNYAVFNNVAVDNAVYPAYNGISCARRRGNIGIWDSAPPTTTVDHNLVHLSKPGVMYVFKNSYSSLAAMQTGTGQEDDGVQGDPLFVGAGGGDLQLSSGSPAIDRGDSGVPGAQDRDILGNPRVRDTSADNSHASGPRPYDDLGAYEFQPGS